MGLLYTQQYTFHVPIFISLGGPSSATPKSKQANAAELILNSLKPEEIKDLVEKITAETLQNVKVSSTLPSNPYFQWEICTGSIDFPAIIMRCYGHYCDTSLCDLCRISL